MKDTIRIIGKASQTYWNGMRSKRETPDFRVSALLLISVKLRGTVAESRIF